MEGAGCKRRWQRNRGGAAALTETCPPSSKSSEALHRERASNPPPLPCRELEEFVDKGFVTVHPRVPPSLHESIIRTADAAYEAAGFSGQQNSSPVGNNILADVPLLREVFKTPEVDALLRGLLGDGYIPHPHRRPHQNDPGSSPQTLHKDSHAGFEVHRYHAPWIVMAMYYPQKVTPEKAPTSVCPRSQFYSGEERFDARHLPGEACAATLRQWGSEEVPLTCEAGAVAVLHNDLWHRGTANRSDLRRWMFCFMFMRAMPPPPVLLPPPELRLEPRPGCATDHVCGFVRRWLQGCVEPAQEVDAQAAAAALADAKDDQPRLAAAYGLAVAADTSSASAALARLLRDTSSEPTRRAAKFGAAAACHRQLLNGDTNMVSELLGLVSDSCDPGAVACAARALHEHGAWAAAPGHLRSRAAAVLSAAAKAGTVRTRSDTAAERGAGPSEATCLRPVGAGTLLGTVRAWKAAQGYGFIKPQTGGEDVFVTGVAFGGGELAVGLQVWYDVEVDRRSGKRCAAHVAGPAVSHSGGRMVGCRNARASALEALAMVPQGQEDECLGVVAQALAREFDVWAPRAQSLVGQPGRQEDGEALMAAALGAVRLVSAVGAGQWCVQLRRSLLALVCGAAQARMEGKPRQPGKGGMPGADNGLRYALAYALEALRRIGDECVLMEAVAALPDVRESLASGRSMEDALLLRRCHLTTKDHTF